MTGPIYVQRDQIVCIWYMETDTGEAMNRVKVYSAGMDLAECRRQACAIPGLGHVICNLIEHSDPSVVCSIPFAEVNISANGKVASVINAERRG